MKIRNSNVNLYNEDCFNRIDNLPNGSIHLALSDPPYAVGFSNSHSREEYTWDKMSDIEYETLIESWLRAIWFKLTDTGSVWFFFAPTKIKSLIHVFEKIERDKLFIVHWENWSVMARSKGRGSSKKLKSLREDYIHLTKTNKYTFNATEYLRYVVAPYREKGGAKRGWWYNNEEDKIPVRFTGLSNVTAFSSDYFQQEKQRGWILDISSGQRLPFDGEPSNITQFSMPSVNNTFERQIHSAQKPVLLQVMLIMMSSNVGDTVIDSFMGSGSSGVAQILTERNYIGIEREKESYEKANNWLQNIDYEKAGEYIKNHVTTSEQKNFKFGV